VRVASGRVVAWFAFDVARAIELARVPAALHPERSRIGSRRPAPANIE
jgi:hypothetical protein